MNSTNNTIAKNIFVLMGSQVTTWTLTLLLTVFLPRYLGAAGIGKLQFATSLWLLVGMMISFGTGTLLTKEIARMPERTSELFGTVVVVRIVLFGAGYALTIMLLRYLAYPPETITVVGIIVAANLMEQFATACQSSLQGLERMSILSVANIVGKSIDTVVGILLLLAGWGIYAIAGLLIVSTTVRLLIQLRFLTKSYPLHLSFRVDTALRMLRSGLPYLMSSIFLVGYLQMNVLIISFLLNEEAIGWYSAADRLFNTLLFIPTIFMMAVFPVFSRLKVSDTAYLHRLMGKSFDSLLLLGVPIGLGMMIVAGPIVTFLFGQDFVNSGPILGVMGVALIFMYLNVLLGQFMISTDRQNTWTVIMAVATVILIGLDITLIPWFHTRWGNGAIGAASAYGLTEFGMVVTGVLLLPKGTLTWTNGWTAARIFGAGFVMVGVAWWLSDQWIVVPILAGAVVYSVLILLMQVVPKEDLQMIIAAVQNFFNRYRRPAPEAVG
ncbi:MAG: flippase [Caldilineaceae bacterium]|nr:flippase [Caldilineaceae bacterium]